MFREKAPLLLGEMRSTLERAATGESIIREAVYSGELDDEKNGLGRFLDSAVDPRAVATTAMGFIAVRPSSEAAELVTTGAIMKETEGTTSICAAKQQSGRFSRSWFQPQLGMTRAR